MLGKKTLRCLKIMGSLALVAIAFTLNYVWGYYLWYVVYVLLKFTFEP